MVEKGLSDSGSLDCSVEFLVHAGNRSLPEAVMTLVPEAWQNDEDMEEAGEDYAAIVGLDFKILEIDEI